MPLLEVSGLRKFYGSFCALDEVSLAVADGQFVSSIGNTKAPIGAWTLVGLDAPAALGIVSATVARLAARGVESAGGLWDCSA